MNHLRHFLLGIGQALTAFGSAPQYRYPSAGDRARDLEMLGADMRAVGRDMKKPASTALNQAHGKDHHRAD
jgi:hypothetical protein